MANVDTNDEPSMEDILASIRKIISDDDETTGGGAQAAAEEEASTDDIDAMFSDAQAEETMEEEPLELTPELEADTDVVFADIEEEAAEEEEPLDLSGMAVEDDIDMDMDMDMSTDDMDTLPQSEDLDFGMADTEAVAAKVEAEVMANMSGGSLLSANAQRSVSSAFGDLAHTILSKNARTLEDLVGEMLKPMLKGWLDDNLPSMVERLVREEIERVTRGGR